MQNMILNSDMAAILNSIVSNSYYKCSGGKYILICPCYTTGISSYQMFAIMDHVKVLSVTQEQDTILHYTIICCSGVSGKSE